MLLTYSLKGKVELCGSKHNILCSEPQKGLKRAFLQKPCKQRLFSKTPKKAFFGLFWPPGRLPSRTPQSSAAQSDEY